MSPTHTRRRGRLYRYYVALKGDTAGDDSIVRRVSAAEIETAVVDQVRALLICHNAYLSRTALVEADGTLGFFRLQQAIDLLQGR